MEGGSADPGSLKPPGAPGRPAPFITDWDPSGAPSSSFHNSGRLVQALGCLSHQPPREEPAPPREPLPSFLEKVLPHFFSAEMFSKSFQYSTWWATCKCAFLPHESWQEPLLSKTSGSQALQSEALCSSNRKPLGLRAAAPPKPRTPRERNQKSTIPGATAHPRLRRGPGGPPCGPEDNHPCGAPATWAAPQPRGAWRACGCFRHRTTPKSAIRTKPRPSLGWWPGHPRTQCPASGVPHLSTPELFICLIYIYEI